MLDIGNIDCYICINCGERIIKEFISNIYIKNIHAPVVELATLA